MLQLHDRRPRRASARTAAARTARPTPAPARPALKVRAARLDGVRVLQPTTLFEDFRGEYVEIYNRELAHAAGIDVDFVQDDISVSTRHVLRGIHGDASTWKLISCLHGRFYLVVVNHDPDSPQYLQWEGFTLSDRNRLQVLVPPRFGNGHLVLSDAGDVPLQAVDLLRPRRPVHARLGRPRARHLVAGARSDRLAARPGRRARREHAREGPARPGRGRQRARRQRAAAPAARPRCRRPREPSRAPRRRCCPSCTGASTSPAWRTA